MFNVSYTLPYMHSKIDEHTHYLIRPIQVGNGVRKEADAVEVCSWQECSICSPADRAGPLGFTSEPHHIGGIAVTQKTLPAIVCTQILQKAL